MGGQVLELVAQKGCGMSVLRDAKICGMWLALSSLLQLSLLWAGDWSRWSPEVPANLNLYCASVSLGEMVGTESLPKYQSDFCCFPTHALEQEPLTGKTGWKWFQLIFPHELKKVVFQHTVELNEIKEKRGGELTHWLHRELEKDGVGNKTRQKD